MIVCTHWNLQSLSPPCRPIRSLGAHHSYEHTLGSAVRALVLAIGADVSCTVTISQRTPRRELRPPSPQRLRLHHLPLRGLPRRRPRLRRSRRDCLRADAQRAARSSAHLSHSAAQALARRHQRADRFSGRGLAERRAGPRALRRAPRHRQRALPHLCCTGRRDCVTISETQSTRLLCL
jgi:hypothetical protein